MDALFKLQEQNLYVYLKKEDLMNLIKFMRKVAYFCWRFSFWIFLIFLCCAKPFRLPALHGEDDAEGCLKGFVFRHPLDPQDIGSQRRCAGTMRKGDQHLRWALKVLWRCLVVLTCQDQDSLPSSESLLWFIRFLNEKPRGIQSSDAVLGEHQFIHRSSNKFTWITATLGNHVMKENEKYWFFFFD